jgi:glycine cleavage system H protein
MATYLVLSNPPNLCLTFYAPVAGEVVEINESLMDIPEHVNNGPYEGGWMIKIQSDDSLDEMLNASDYESHVGS